MKSGLHFVDQGVRGVVVETDPLEYDRACDRCAQLQAHVDLLPPDCPGGLLVLHLIAEGLVLHASTLQATLATGKATLHRNDKQFEMELDMGGGWRDRRLLPGVVVRAIQRNRGLNVAHADLRWAENAIARLAGYAGLERPIEQAILDAGCWWYSRLGGPLFSHASRLRSWQPLDRAARARVAYDRPQLAPSTSSDTDDQRMTAAVESSLRCSSDMGVVNRLRRRFGQIVAEKGTKDQGRQRMLEVLEDELPAAVQAGRAQALIVAGTHYVVRSGGVSGKPLAPVTLCDYFSKHVVRLAEDLLKNGEAGRTGWDWIAAYDTMVTEAEETQRAKLVAFLEAFHRFLVLVGAEPLPVGIRASSPARPPVAAVVTDIELDLALEFVLHAAETERIASQARLVLLLASEVELRTYEPWCIRLEDVRLEAEPYLLIFPRQRDGIGKTRAVRRQVGLVGDQLVSMLSEFKRHRLGRDHADEQDDLLFGHPGVLHQRHEQDKTMHLVNAALRWATGWPRASFYDLRHTVFSRKIGQLLQEGAHAADVASLHQIAAEGGHAGPGSSWAYVHQFEEALALAQRKARPQAWEPAQAHPLDAALFPDIGQGVLAEAHATLPTSAKASRGASNPEPPLSFRLRFEIARRLNMRKTVPEVAGHCQVPAKVVLDCVRQMAKALADADMADKEGLRAVSRQVQMIREQRALVAAATHPKWTPLRNALERLDLKSQSAVAHELSNAWQRCKRGVDLSLERELPASVLLDFLVGSGIPLRDMAITAPESAMPLPVHLKRHNLTWRRGQVRSGVPRYRLSVVPLHVEASTAQARQVSMKGLHFWMVLLRSAIAEKEI